MSLESFDEKDRVRESVDLLEIVGQSLEVRRQGRGYVALCPWHDDSKPSLQINPARQSWKCWVCDVGGDVFSFVMRRENVGFREALEMLAEQAGISLTRTKKRDSGPKAKRTMLAAMAWAEQRYHRYLLSDPEAGPAREYLHDRGFSLESIERFRIGFAPMKWQWLCDQAAGAGYALETLDAVGLASKNQRGGYRDFFGGRVLFPIRDVLSRPIAMGGRILPQYADGKTGKYINSRETRLYSKSENLYALDIVKNAKRRDGKILVMEGYTDVVAAHQQGVTEAVAVLGTALGPRHVRLLRRFTDQVWLVLDGDEAGQRRANEVLELFVAENIDLRVLTLPQGLDPCDFLLNDGADAFRTLESSALTAMDHKIQVSLDGVDLANDPHASSNALEQILGVVAQAGRSETLASSEQQLREENLIAFLARRFHVEAGGLRKRIRDMRRKRRGNASEQGAASGKRVAAESQRVVLHAGDRDLLQILLQAPECLDVAAQQIGRLGVQEGPARDVFDALLALRDQQQPPDFATLMTTLEDPQLKNLVVQLDELNAEQADAVAEGPDERLRQLIERRRHQELRQANQRIRRDLGLGSDQTLEESASKLQALIENQRLRQGISPPKEG